MSPADMTSPLISKRRIERTSVMICALAFFSTPLSAEDFCVGTADDFHTVLTEAAANQESDTIRLAQGAFLGKFIYASHESHKLELTGGWSADCSSLEPGSVTVLDGQASGTTLAISGPSMLEVRVSGLQVVGGRNSVPGAGLFVQIVGAIHLSNLHFSGNAVVGSGSGGGGAAFLSGSAIEVATSTFNGNRVETSQGGGCGITLEFPLCSSGGAILADGDSVQITGSKFENNTATLYGGAISVGSRCKFGNVRDNDFVNNDAHYGGGLSAFCTNVMSVSDSAFLGNRSSSGGAAFLVCYEDAADDGECRIYRNTFDSNQASTGGALRFSRGPFVVRANKFLGNQGSQGGAIHSSAAEIRLHGNMFLRNSGSEGGAFWHDFSDTNVTQALALESNLFEDNSAEYGGALFVRQRSENSVDIMHNTLVGNTASVEGGALNMELYEGGARILNNAFLGNIAQQGSDLYFRNDMDADFFASPVDVRGNLLDIHGGGLGSTLPLSIDKSNFEWANDGLLLSNGELPLDSYYFPLVDRGVDEIGSFSTDMDGNVRVQGPRPDVGAHERRPTVLVAPLEGWPDVFFSAGWSDIFATFMGTSTVAASSLRLAEAGFLQDSARGGGSIQDISGNGAPELVVYGVTEEGTPRVQFRDGSTGEFIRTQKYFGESWHPLDTAALTHLVEEGSHELAMLSRNLVSGEIAVQIRDSVSGQFVSNVFFFSSEWRARQLVALREIDMNPGQELGVLATNTKGRIVVMIKDAKTNTFIGNVFFLNENWAPIHIIVLDDISDNGSEEIGLLARNKDSGQLVIMVKDAATNTFLNNVFPLGSGWAPIKLVALPDENANGSQELALLSANEATGKLVIQVRDSLTGQFLRNLEPLGSNWEPKDMIVLPEIGRGIPGLSVMATRKSEELSVVQTIEATSGALVSNIFLH